MSSRITSTWGPKAKASAQAHESDGPDGEGKHVLLREPQHGVQASSSSSSSTPFLGDVYAVEGGHMVFGEFIKTSPAGSTRPIDVFPYVWTGLSTAQRLERIKGFPERQRLRDLETIEENR